MHLKVFRPFPANSADACARRTQLIEEIRMKRAGIGKPFTLAPAVRCDPRAHERRLRWRSSVHRYIKPTGNCSGGRKLSPIIIHRASESRPANTSAPTTTHPSTPPARPGTPRDAVIGIGLRASAGRASAHSLVFAGAAA